MTSLRILTLTLCLHISFINADKFDYYITQTSLSAMSKLGQASAGAACYSAVESAHSLYKGKFRKAAGHTLESAAWGALTVSCLLVPDCELNQCWFENKETVVPVVFSGLFAFLALQVAILPIAADELEKDGVMANLCKFIP